MCSAQRDKSESYRDGFAQCIKPSLLLYTGERVSRMKKISLLLALVLVLCAGCSASDVPEIDEYTWKMTSIQSAEADGQAVAYGPHESSTLDTAVELEMQCTAQDGSLTLTDLTNNKTYTGTYRVQTTSPESVTYAVTVADQNGLAVCAMTTYHDGSTTPTLIINLGDYVLNFFAAEE